MNCKNIFFCIPLNRGNQWAPGGPFAICLLFRIAFIHEIIKLNDTSDEKSCHMKNISDNFMKQNHLSISITFHSASIYYHEGFSIACSRYSRVDEINIRFSRTGKN